MKYQVLKTTLAMLLAILLCLGLVACGTGETEEPKEPDAQEQPDGTPDEQEPDDGASKITTANYPLAQHLDKLKVYGRSSVVGTGISCDFTASGIEFSAYLEGDVKLKLTCTADTYFTVYVDGVRMEDRKMATTSTSELTVASFAEGGDHTILVLKQTEPWMSLSVLESLEFT